MRGPQRLGIISFSLFTVKNRCAITTKYRRKVALTVYDTDLIGPKNNTHVLYNPTQVVTLTSHYRWPFTNQIVYSIPRPIPQSVRHLTKQSPSDRIFPCLKTPRAKHVL